MTFCHKNQKYNFCCENAQLRQFCRKNSMIAFEDLLASSIAPQDMPPCTRCNFWLKFGKPIFEKWSSMQTTFLKGASSNSDNSHQFVWIFWPEPSIEEHPSVKRVLVCLIDYIDPKLSLRICSDISNILAANIWLREGLNEKKTFSFGHCPNHLNPSPPWPQFGHFGPLFWTSRTTFCEYDRIFFKWW